MHGPINVKSPNNTSKWQMGFNSAFKGLNTELNPICHLLTLLGAHHIFHVSGVKVNFVEGAVQTEQHKYVMKILTE
jgi:hypothetical protein